MPASPKTPQHSRHSSVADGHSASPNARRYSRSSVSDAPTPFRNSLSHQDTIDMSVLASVGGQASNSLGNLADELADAFSDFGDEEDAVTGEVSSDQGSGDASKLDYYRDSGVDVNDAGGSDGEKTKDAKLTIPSPPRRGHQKKGSEYDGSEYGSESDLDAAGFTTNLIARIDAVESLVRRGTESYGRPGDDVFKRVTESLRDLGSQSSVEGNASRLITAHTALTTHLAHQTRQLHNLTFPLLSPLVPTPDLDTIDDLVPLLVSLLEAMPTPSTVAFNSLAALHSITVELIQTLSYLSDTLHMSRQTIITATRRLKSSKELVAELKRDEELREEGERWLSRGNWGERLQKRECAGVCGDVIGGFEAVCDGWRERLLAQGESTA
ncbi:hypothetical protein A9K55_000858 [Cordyceps militaris]|uniref:Uncharacterized protein n=1 Tax=Cordyceps militaris TaxID=73501 RepID=A0A2H4SUE1_CORMI|nr:hypothetical protein A9K55_000858 [Cordyceps militaris]